MRTLKDDFEKHVQAFGTKYKMYVIGALHSISAAKDNSVRFDKEKPRNVIPDRSWWNYPCKIYLFEELYHQVSETVKFIAIEDNVNYRFVSFFR